MAQIYNEMRILEFDEATGECLVGWYDGTLANGGTGPGLETPIEQQKILRLGMKIPIEFEQNSWTRTQLRDFWLGSVEDVADIPQWAKDEANTTKIRDTISVEIIS